MQPRNSAYIFCSISVVQTISFCRKYARMYPNLRHPDANVINGAIRRLRETGNVIPQNVDAGRQRRVRNVATEELVLNMVDANRRTSTRAIGQELGISHVTVHKILKEDHQHPYHFKKVQQLLPGDFERRRVFCERLTERMRVDPFFSRRILYTDECTYTQNGTFNSNNYHYYGHENPHLMWDINSQHRFSINVWAGLIDNELIGPVFLPERLNGQHYLRLLREELPDLLFPPNVEANMPEHRRNIIFMHDGCPAHYAGPVREYLNNTYGNNWMGRGAPVWKWPARSPDLNPCDFYLWGTTKGKIYFSRIDTRDELEEAIHAGFRAVRQDHVQAATTSVFRRARICLESEGGHFEHFL